jgi:hypothetical protein
MRAKYYLAIALLKNFIDCRLVALRPLKCFGSFCISSQTIVPAAYLSRGKLEVLESEEDGAVRSAILCDVIPIPLLDSRGESLVNQLQNDRSKSTKSSFDPSSIDGILVNRDKGLYDNLPYVWGENNNAKLELYNYLQKRRGPSNKGNFLEAVNAILGSKLTGIMIEVKDQLASDRIVLGGAIVLCQNAVAEDWKISASNPKMPAVASNDDTEEIADATACLVECHMDELVALSFLSGLPIHISKTLFDSLAIDATLTSGEEKTRGTPEMLIYGPAFRSAESKLEWDQRSAVPNGAASTRTVPPAWDIFDAKKFIGMSSVEKRATLRASGVTSLPRPREGLDSLDRALLDKMDDAVRGEYLRLRSLKGSDTAPVKSPRQSVLKAMGEAFDAGDIETATELREEFMMMTARTADPTQESGSYDPYLDQDDWYMAARRKAMAPKK